MRRYTPRPRRRRSRRYRRPTNEAQRKFIRGFLFMIAIILLIVFFFGDHGIYQLYRLKLERAATQKLIAELRAERNTLEEEKDRLEVDLEYIERLARERYRMAKKGEKVFKVIPKKSK